jgi:hypothetical protein
LMVTVQSEAQDHSKPYAGQQTRSI